MSDSSLAKSLISNRIYIPTVYYSIRYPQKNVASPQLLALIVNFDFGVNITVLKH